MCPTVLSMFEVVVRAELTGTGLWTQDGVSIAVGDLPLSDRLICVLDDWMAFYDDLGGELSDDDVRQEFVGQGYKIAYAIRRELKGSTVWLTPPNSDELIAVDYRRPS